MGVESYLANLGLVAPTLLIAVAWVVARSPQADRANRLFATFLAIVSAGFALEYVATVWGGAREDAVWAGLHHLQDLSGYADPPILLAFALCFASPLRARSRHLLVGGYALVGTSLFFAAFITSGRPEFRPPALAAAELLYVNGTYAAAFFLLLRSFVHEPRRMLAGELRFLAIGVGFTAVTRSLAIAFPLGLPMEAATGWAALLGGLVLLTAAITTPPRARSARVVLVPVLILSAAFFTLIPLLASLNPWIEATTGSPWFHGPVAFVFGYRWIVFALLVGYGVLRYQLLDLEVRALDAGALLIAVPAAVAGSLVAGASTSEWGYAGSHAVSALGHFLLLVPAFFLARSVFRRLFPDAGRSFEASRRLDLYEAALEHAFRKPEWSEEDRRFIDTLREVFEVTDEEHESILARLGPDPPARDRAPEAIK